MNVTFLLFLLFVVFVVVFPFYLAFCCCCFFNVVCYAALLVGAFTCPVAVVVVRVLWGRATLRASLSGTFLKNVVPKLQALVYDILEEGAGKRCSECGASPQHSDNDDSNRACEGTHQQRRPIVFTARSTVFVMRMENE